MAGEGDALAELVREHRAEGLADEHGCPYAWAALAFLQRPRVMAWPRVTRRRTRDSCWRAEVLEPLTLAGRDGNASDLLESPVNRRTIKAKKFSQQGSASLVASPHATRRRTAYGKLL
jgi:hypothetical protein